MSKVQHTTCIPAYASLVHCPAALAPAAPHQVLVQENVAKLPDGLLFVADKQYGGKGGPGLGSPSWRCLPAIAAGLAGSWLLACWPQRGWAQHAAAHGALPADQPSGCPRRREHQILPSGSAGRGGNVWESPDGCLMFSAVKRLDIPGQRLPFVQYIVSLAVVQAVQAAAAAALQVRAIRTGKAGGRAGTSAAHWHAKRCALLRRLHDVMQVCMCTALTAATHSDLAILMASHRPPATGAAAAAALMCASSGPTTCMPGTSSWAASFATRLTATASFTSSWG